MMLGRLFILLLIINLIRSRSINSTISSVRPHTSTTNLNRLHTSSTNSNQPYTSTTSPSRPHTSTTSPSRSHSSTTSPIQPYPSSKNLAQNPARIFPANNKKMSTTNLTRSTKSKEITTSKR